MYGDGTIFPFTWATDQPNNWKGDEQCVTYIHTGRLSPFSDVHCEKNKAAVVCQVDPTPNPQPLSQGPPLPPGDDGIAIGSGSTNTDNSSRDGTTTTPDPPLCPRVPNGAKYRAKVLPTLCQKGYRYLNDMCYKLYKHPSSHSAAQSTCVREGATLIEPRSLADLNLMDAEWGHLREGCG